MSGISLYERAEQMDAALAALESAESQEEREVALQVVDEAAGELFAKVDRFSEYLAHLDNVEQFADAEVKRLQQRAKQAKSRREHLEQYAIRIMQQRGWQEMEGETSTLKLRTNPPSVVISDEHAVPVEYIKITQTQSVDKIAVKAALKGGKEVPGAALESKIALKRS